MCEAIAAAGDLAGARAAIAEARDHLLAHAAKVVDPVLRRTLARAAAWIG